MSRFAGLSRVPLYLLFYDAEESFPAQCILLFEDSVRFYLDMESVAMLGAVLEQFFNAGPSLQRTSDMN